MTLASAERVGSTALLIMACSGAKLTRAAPALELYRGVMYSTFRANVQPAARPHVVILSALHGFITADTDIEPYEQRMTRARADVILKTLDSLMRLNWPAGVANIMLAGGADYRRVMRVAIARLVASGCLSVGATVCETAGGIGYQRQQLGAFLRGLAPAPEIVGYHSNGTPLFRSLDDFTVGQSVHIVYRSRPDLAARPAVVEALFLGPAGHTASVRLLDARNPGCAKSWVGLHDMQPAAPEL